MKGAYKNFEELKAELSKKKYIVDDEFAIGLFLLTSLQRPLLIEGPPGVGKTEIALTLANLLDTKLIRLQCYEGMDINSTTYEWNYQKQLLKIKLLENEQLSLKEKEENVFNQDYLLTRPILQSLMEKEKSPVLLIDEIDRADEDFEALLLEILSAFQVSIPEVGTIKAKHIPYIILTSNRTRELSDALRRRCLYHWIDYPSLEKELNIVSLKLPHIEKKLLTEVVNLVQKIRTKKINKIPGISETMDWAESLHHLGTRNIKEDVLKKTIGCVVKSIDDQNIILSDKILE